MDSKVWKQIIVFGRVVQVQQELEQEEGLRDKRQRDERGERVTLVEERFRFFKLRNAANATVSRRALHEKREPRVEKQDGLR